uniref:Uncharacterized protein n=1 Tax=Molossus molossus TaxID=27622 RepID=A0A7J8GKZ0_MOLMO|nr:hypothetical protein HJG59_011442 [Molossus molossus]
MITEFDLAALMGCACPLSPTYASALKLPVKSKGTTFSKEVIRVEPLDSRPERIPITSHQPSVDTGEETETGQCSYLPEDTELPQPLKISNVLPSGDLAERQEGDKETAGFRGAMSAQGSGTVCFLFIAMCLIRSSNIFRQAVRIRKEETARPVWLSGLSVVPWMERPWLDSWVRAHGWIVGLIFRGDVQEAAS